MSPARLALAAGLIFVACVLMYLVQVAQRKRRFSLYGALFATGVAVVGLLMVNVGVQGLGVHL